MLEKTKAVSGKNNKEIFETMPIPKALATLAIPTIIGQLVVLIYSLADTFYIGRTNNPLMVAGASLILPVYNICIFIAGLAGVGGGTYQYARQYAFCVIVLGALPTVMSVTMSNLLRSVSCAKQAGFGVSMGDVINIFLDPLLCLCCFRRGWRQRQQVLLPCAPM